MKTYLSRVMYVMLFSMLLICSVSCNTVSPTGASDVDPSQSSSKTDIDLSDPLIQFPPFFDQPGGKEPLGYDEEPSNTIVYDQVIYSDDSGITARTTQDTYGQWLTTITVAIQNPDHSEVNVCSEMVLQRWLDGTWQTILESEEERAKYGFTGRYVEWKNCQSAVSLEKN